MNLYEKLVAQIMRIPKPIRFFIFLLTFPLWAPVVLVLAIIVWFFLGIVTMIIETYRDFDN